MSIGINGDIEKIKALEDNILEQYNKNAELEKKMEQETEKFAEQANTAIKDYNSNAETKTEEFNSNARKKTDEFNNNAIEKKSEINTISENFKKMAETKTTEFNNNSNTKTEEFNNNSTEKINDFNSNAEEKIAEYDEHVETLTSRIAELEEETEDLYNALNTEQISGNELYIDDAKPCRIMNTEISGMYKQETTTGKQLFNPILDTTTQSGITLTKNTDGTYIATGTATGTAFFVIGAFNFIANTNYILNGCPPNGSLPTYQIILADTANAYDTGDGYNCVFTEDTTKNVVIRVQKGVTVNNIVFKPMISLIGGVPSPNPNYPQAIEQVENVKLIRDSSNLFNITDYNNLKLIKNGNATITKTENVFSFVTTTDNYCGAYIVIDELKKYIDNNKDDTAYNISFDVSATKNTNFRYGTETVKVTTINTYKTRCSFTGILSKPFTWYSISQEAGTTITISNIKVTKTEDTEYTPYQNKTINVDLKGNKLCAISDTIKDKLLIDRNGNVALQKNVNYSTFTAFTTVNGNYSKSTQFILALSNCVKNVEQNSFNALSNCMLKNITDGGMGFFGTTSVGNVRVTVLNSLLNVTQEDTTSTKLNAAKTFLQNLQQTPEIYYPAEVPELIDLGQLPELPKTFSGVNNIWAETNLGNTEIEIEYVQDVKKLLEKQAEQQNARLDNIENLLSTTETSALLLDNMQNDLEKEVE